MPAMKQWIRRNIPALIVFGLAFAIFTTSGATANRFVNSRDIQDGTVRSRDIRDGTIKARDLAPHLRGTVRTDVQSATATWPGDGSRSQTLVRCPRRLGEPVGGGFEIQSTGETAQGVRIVTSRGTGLTPEWLVEGFNTSGEPVMVTAWVVCGR